MIVSELTTSDVWMSSKSGRIWRSTLGNRRVRTGIMEIAEYLTQAGRIPVHCELWRVLGRLFAETSGSKRIRTRGSSRIGTREIVFFGPTVHAEESDKVRRITWVYFPPS